MSRTVRIPIRKWEKVVDPLYTFYSDFPGGPSYPVRQRWAENERYRLEVMINGEILGCDVSVPGYLQRKDEEGFRRHIIASLSNQIAGVVADEIRRTIA
ncbi:hypothetical protein [Burkholderia vietnamiensis]|uniref:hypothetical protein n=1 Tax=Burkholderia vietnamiensis TaxID=60552 RepID=UPI0026564BA3|nr:hypothetical protein [Burkholderia vietnamiensis]MDN8037422.1 hypothetical protein [Burkholderia vietnamiensis]